MKLHVVGKNHSCGFLKYGVSNRSWNEAEDVHGEL